eukprot:1369737-Prymnesium_polylepis.1
MAAVVSKAHEIGAVQFTDEPLHVLVVCADVGTAQALRRVLSKASRWAQLPGALRGSRGLSRSRGLDESANLLHIVRQALQCADRIVSKAASTRSFFLGLHVIELMRLRKGVEQLVPQQSPI